MTDFDAVRARLEADPDFRAKLVSEPRRALEQYDLSTDDLTRLADELADGSKDAAPRAPLSLRGLLTGRADQDESRRDPDAK